MKTRKCSNKNCHTGGEDLPITDFHYRAGACRWASECKQCVSNKGKAKRASGRAAASVTRKKTTAKEETAIYDSFNSLMRGI